MENDLSIPENCSIIPAPVYRPEATQCALELASVRILEIQNPFRPGEYVESGLSPLDNESVGALLARAGYAVERFEVSVNGERIPADAVWSTVIRAGQELVLFPCTGGSGMSRSLAMIGLIVAIALFTGVGVPFIGFAAMMGLGATLTSIIALTPLAAGSMLISWALAPGQPHAPSYSSTYDPTGPKGLAQPGTPVPKAYGVMEWAGNVISSFVTFDGPTAYISALVCYGFGQAVSIANILLNGKPISEYNGATYYLRLGSNEQGPLSGFNQTINGFPQQTQLLVTNGPVTVPGTGTDVEGLQITTKFPSGLFRVTGDGNYVPLKLIYTIQISPHGQNAWTEPMFANMTQSIATVHTDGSVTWPQWVVVPTDRFAGSGIVYDYINFGNASGQYVGMPWSQVMRVSTVAIDGSTSDVNATFTGEWQLCDPSLEQVEVLSWQQGYRVVINDTLTAFFDTVSIYGLTSGQWDVRVTKVGYLWDQGGAWDVVYADSTDAKHVCDVWLWNINEITLSDLAYPNMVLVGVKALATSQLSGANLQVMATITHDIGEDTVLPASLAGFEHDNPAIVAYDVLSNTLYGMGVTPSNIDVPAFVAWAQFCDETVTNQDGTTARRFVFAGVFDQSSDAWKTLQTIGRMSRAAILQSGLRYTVVLDAPADPVQLFTIGNTKKDSFRESWLSLDDRASLIECDFADAARNYRMDLPVSVMTEADLNSGLAPKPTRTKLIGCTSRDQAWRWAYFHLMSTKLALRTVEFEAPVEACCCLPGSVTAVQSDVTQWASGGRIQAGSTLSTVNVDNAELVFTAGAGYTVSVQHPLIQRGNGAIQSITGLAVTMTTALPAGRIMKAVSAAGVEFIVTGYSGSTVTLASSTGALAVGQVLTFYDANVIEALTVTALAVTGTGATLTVAGNFQAIPTTDSAWAYGASAGSQPAKLFRVTQMKKSGDFNFVISGIEYNADVYLDVTPNYGEIVGVPNVTPSITALTLVEQFQNGSFTGSPTSSVIAVSWQNGNTAVGALVETQAAGGTWTSLGKIHGDSCTFIGVIGTAYQVRVTGFDWQGNLLGSPAVGSITVTASTNVPGNVIGFNCAVEALATPAAPTGAASTTGGTLPAGTYTVQIAAIDGLGNTTPAGPSAAFTTTGTTSSVALTWAAVPNATSYMVWLSTGQSFAAATPSFTLTTPTGTPGTIPVANTSAVSVLSWAAVTGADHYEIRYQASQSYYPWDTATILWDGPALTWTDTTMRSGMYMIVAVLSVVAGGLQSLTPAYATAYANPPIVTLTQSATNSSGSGGSQIASSGVTVNSTGGLTTSAIVWLTIAWTWPSNYPTPSGFNVIAFTGSDPTAVANYLFDMVTVGAGTLSCTIPVCPTNTMSIVNAAVRAIYA